MRLRTFFEHNNYYLVHNKENLYIIKYSYGDYEIDWCSNQKLSKCTLLGPSSKLLGCLGKKYSIDKVRLKYAEYFI